MSFEPWFPSDDVNVASVQLCTRSWYGHPEGSRIEEDYNRKRGAKGMIPEPWVSGLRCWNLLDAEGLKIGRAYEPTMRVPRWVFVDERGDRELSLNISMEKLQALIVEHRLKGGPE